MHIACVLAPGFEDSEFRVPYDRFRAAGHEVTIIGLQGNQKLAGKRGREKVKSDVGIEDVRPGDFDALFIPGGHSPDHLRADERMVDFVRAFADKPIFAICHGPQLLIAADLHRGRRLTAWRTVQADLGRMSADVVDEEVVVDGQLVTSREPDDLDAFVGASLAVLEGAEQPSMEA
jgi:protease I